MCLSVCIIVSIARKRPPVTQAFYFTVQLVIEELFNCVPGATSVGREQHMDGIAARLEAGIFGSVSGYLGVIEAQMRKMLHLHMLVQLHGFSHPDDIFAEAICKPESQRCGALSLLFVFVARKRSRDTFMRTVLFALYSNRL